MTSFRLAVLHLARHRSSTLIAVVCVAAASFAAGTLIAIFTGVSGPFAGLDTPYDALVGPKSSGLSVLLGALGAEDPSREVIPYSLARFLERKKIARSLVPLHAIGRVGEFNVFGTDNRYLERPSDLHPPTIADGTWFSSPDEAVMGATAYEKSELKIGDTLSVEGLLSSATQEESHWEKSLRLVGVLGKTDSPLDRLVFVSLETGKEAYVWAKERGLIRETKDNEAVTYLWVSPNPGDRAALEHWIHAASVGHYVNAREQLAFLRRILQGAQSGAWALGAFVLFMAGIAIAVLANARYESLRPELGVLRALGYTQSQVAGWMLWESLLISLAGLLLAILSEAIGLRAIDLPYRLEWSATPTPWPTAWSGAVYASVLLTSIVAAGIAVLRLYRADVQKAIQGF